MRRLAIVALLMGISAEAFAQSSVGSYKEQMQQALRKEQEAMAAMQAQAQAPISILAHLLASQAPANPDGQNPPLITPQTSSSAGQPASAGSALQSAMTTPAPGASAPNAPRPPQPQVVVLQLAPNALTNALVMQAAANLAETSAQAGTPVNVPPLEMAALGKLETLFSQASTKPQNAQQAATVPTDADAQRALREAEAQRILAEALARAGLGTGAGTAPASSVENLVETLKAAAREQKEAETAPRQPSSSATQAAAPSPGLPAAVSNLVAQQTKEIERLQQQAKQNLAAQSAAKTAASTAETSHPRVPAPPPVVEPPPPLPVWPAWMGANARYAAVFHNDAAPDSNGFRASYSGEMRATIVPVDPAFITVGTIGPFTMHFDAMGNGNVGITGSLSGHDISGTITDRAVNGFTANLNRPANPLANAPASSGELAGKFYGADSGMIGGTFQTHVPGSSNTHGHFAGTAQ